MYLKVRYLLFIDKNRLTCDRASRQPTLYMVMDVCKQWWEQQASVSKHDNTFAYTPSSNHVAKGLVIMH